MDLHESTIETLSIDEYSPPLIEKLLEEASVHNIAGNAESWLKQACYRVPANLSALVALYRFYFIQERFDEALTVTQQIMSAVAPRIHFPNSWRKINNAYLEKGALSSVNLVRFYLLTLKAAGYVNLQRGAMEEGTEMLRKIVELDNAEEEGAELVLSIMSGSTADSDPFPLFKKALP